ncbi:class IV adenylate cyclase [Salinarchaeum sp. IM2453]|uniref:class IV adenylate cyclase n=1 Tax=Salinarchaeum sp. IM2453 TaxID=2862870 RepID=UPI001C836FC7|nr:class IV adenylate cyclase [Salinarchaeum sp. IM2453]QZA88867.1 class IV adenylate cyclase [Salinarchaeum sp. IM2453]
MYEVELKVRADHETIKSRLEESNITVDRAIIQEDTYYNAPHRDFAETDEALRIRRQQEQSADEWEVIVTYKGPLLDEKSKTREEIETHIADGETFDTTLQRLGFTPAATVRKEREYYQLGEYELTLDAVKDVGTFIEIETETETDIEEAREGAYEQLEELGLDPEDHIQQSYLGMLLED